MRACMRMMGVLAVLLVAGLQSACEPVRSPMEPQSVEARFAPGQRLSQKVRFASGMHGEPVTGMLTSGGGALLLRTDAGVPLVRLDVPGGAVPGTWVEFTMSLEPGDVAGEYTVELSATSWGSTTPNDVGGRGFRKPVRLSFNLEALETAGLPLNRLGVAELKDGALLPVPSQVDRRTGWLTGVLNHFSGYVPITD